MVVIREDMPVKFLFAESRPIKGLYITAKFSQEKKFIKLLLQF